MMEVVLPGAATALCLALAWQMLRRFIARRRVHELVWGVTFSAFGLAAGAEMYGTIFGWTPGLVRLYYLNGALLPVGFLALGTLVLLVPRPIAFVALGVVLVQSLFAVFLVLRAGVDPEAVKVAGWTAMSRDASVRALTLTINVLGTIVVLMGTFGSAYNQWSRGSGRRALGVFLIGAGTLIVASGASFTRYGHHFLYGPMVIGLLVIYAGYLRVTAPAAPPLITETDQVSESHPEVAPADGTISAGQTGGRHGNLA
jgi:hypothetical protein